MRHVLHPLRQLVTLLSVVALSLLLTACDGGLTQIETADPGSSPGQGGDLLAMGPKPKVALCHLSGDTYYLLELPEKPAQNHRNHGDLDYNPDPSDTDPSDGDIYCAPEPEPTVCTDGRIAFASTRDGTAGTLDEVEIYLMNGDGSNVVRLTDNNSLDARPAVSPDGTKIAFVSTRDGVSGSVDDEEIYVMNIDGSGVVRLTNNNATDRSPAWSPDGTKIAFVSGRDAPGWDVYVMNADGSGQTPLTANNNGEFFPFWSPDGTQIFFGSDRDAQQKIYVMNADGTGQTLLTSTPPEIVEDDPAVSPDGTKIAYQGYDNVANTWDLFVMNTDGSNPVNLTNDNTVSHTDASWSPDGAKITYRRTGTDPSEVFTMNADGSNPVNLTNNDAVDANPDWAACPAP